MLLSRQLLFSDQSVTTAIHAEICFPPDFSRDPPLIAGRNPAGAQHLCRTALPKPAVLVWSRLGCIGRGRRELQAKPAFGPYRRGPQPPDVLDVDGHPHRPEATAKGVRRPAAGHVDGGSWERVRCRPRECRGSMTQAGTTRLRSAVCNRKTSQPMATAFLTYGIGITLTLTCQDALWGRNADRR